MRLPENQPCIRSDDMTPEEREDISAARENRLRSKYPLHIYLMVKAAASALSEGRAEIKKGELIVQPPAVSYSPRSKPERTRLCPPKKLDRP